MKELKVNCGEKKASRKINGGMTFSVGSDQIGQVRRMSDRKARTGSRPPVSEATDPRIARITVVSDV